MTELSLFAPPVSRALDARIGAVLDGKTKPLGALGRLEALAAQLARVQQSLTPKAQRCTLLLFAADHGIAAEGVSAYPQAVTRQMVANFLAGGAAANVIAAQAGVEVQVVDAGVAGPALVAERLISARVGPGTANAALGPAMSREALEAALGHGVRLAQAAPGEALALGEMGIGNTSSAALLANKLTGLPLAALIGAGTGLDAAGMARKGAVLEAAAGRTATPLPPLDALCEYGGFEIAMMAGAMLGAAQTGRLVLVDGFIAGAAALAAVRLAPDVRDYCVFAHRSAERGHGAVLEALGAAPLLDLGLRLGEGTGALLAWPLVKAAAALFAMASFADAQVSGPACEGN